jgi:hypothetical protein
LLLLLLCLLLLNPELCLVVVKQHSCHNPGTQRLGHKLLLLLAPHEPHWAQLPVVTLPRLQLRPT